MSWTVQTTSATAAALANPTHLLDTEWDWPTAPNTEGYYNSDIIVIPESADQTTDGYFYANYWTWKNYVNEGGYLGIQTSAGHTSPHVDQKVAIFSVWDVPAGNASSPTGTVVAFDNEGEGASIRIAYNWVRFRPYRLRVSRTGINGINTAWTAYVKDMVTGVETTIGTILVPTSRGWIASSSCTFHERYTGPISGPSDLKPSSISVVGVRMNNNTVQPTAQNNIEANIASVRSVYGVQTVNDGFRSVVGGTLPTLVTRKSGFEAGADTVQITVANSASAATPEGFTLNAARSDEFTAGTVNPAPALTAPTNVVATAGDGQITLTWDAVPTADSYDIYRTLTAGNQGTWHSWADPPAQSYIDTGLTNGTRYYYMVVALRGSEYVASQQVSAVPTGTVVTPPTRGNLPGWTLIFDDDFTTPVAEGAWYSTYNNVSRQSGISKRWSAYDEDYLTTYGSNQGTGDRYSRLNISVVSGINGANGNAMKLRLYRETPQNGGRAVGAAPEPILPSGSTHQQYGRYEVRFKADTNVPGWKTAWLLWPQEDDNGTKPWPASGETDFPEGSLNDEIAAFHHNYNGTSGGDQVGFDTNVTYANWHVAVIEWKPNFRRFILDGVVIGTVTSRVTPTPMRYVMQTENNLGGTQPAYPGTCNVYIDYMAVWSYTP